MRFWMALGEMKAKSNQPILPRAVITVQNCAFEQPFFQIPANFILNAFDTTSTRPVSKVFGTSVARPRFLKSWQLQRCWQGVIYKLGHGVPRSFLAMC